MQNRMYHHEALHTTLVTPQKETQVQTSAGAHRRRVLVHESHLEALLLSRR